MMRFIVVYTVLFFSIQICFSQVNLVPNGGFEYGSNPPACLTGLGQWSDFDANISYWECAMENANCKTFNPGKCPTPDWLDKTICTLPLANGTIPTNSPSNRFVGLLKDNGSWHEGVRTSLLTSLVPYKFYTIRVRVAMTSNFISEGGRLNVHFSNLSENWNSNSANRLPNAVQFILNQNKPHEWYTLEKTFLYEGLHTDLNNIILIRDVADYDYNYMLLDDVELFESSSFCRNFYKFENRNYIYPEVSQNGNCLPYEVNDFIHAGYDADNQYTVNGDVKVKLGAKVAYKAGEEVSLLPGFIVEPGGDFRAYIADCGKECKYPESFISENNNITICSNGVHCWDLGRPAKYGETYLWTSEPSWGVNYLSSTNISNPKLCIDTYTLPADFGNIRFFLNVSNACNDNCDCSSLTVSYDLQGANRYAPVIYASNTTPTNATGLFECYLDLSGTTGKFIVEVYYTNWDNYYDPIWTPSPNGPYTYYDGIDYNRGNNFSFQFNVHENGFNHPPFRFKFHFIAKNACDTEQGDAWSDIYEWVDD
ncbi:MAG: 3-coathanger stack domain-containing protein [Bacteroidia bacterium]